MSFLDMLYLHSVRILDDQIYQGVMTPGHPTRKVMETLKERGIAVWIHWVSSTNGDLRAYE